MLSKNRIGVDFMKNPIRSAREQLELNERNLALLVGVTEQTIRVNESGDNLTITKKVLNFFIEQGFEEKQLIEDYEKFRAWRKEQLLKSVKRKNA
jgi:DNA-binding XRE family transcriptional regulator